jgi:5-oxoprolinase (ATP-hydrolysing)
VLNLPVARVQARGFATNAHNLVTFGGAGGQHACAIARNLGIQRIIIHKYSSILSAYGIGLANTVSDVSEPATYTFSKGVMALLLDRFQHLREQVEKDLAAQGIDSSRIDYENFLSMRYEGSDTNLTISQPVDGDFVKAFIEQHRREFAFELDGRPIVVDNARVRGIGKGLETRDSTKLFAELKSASESSNVAPPSPAGRKSVYFDGKWKEVSLYLLDELKSGDKFKGPALIIDNTQTVFVEAGAHVFILSAHVVIENGQESGRTNRDLSVNPIQLSLFGHRFMSIAEQMGNTLQRTSISTSIKERLDFSCAIFSANAKLVANAPHIPIHLGSMQFAIQYQHKLWEGKLAPGDVLLTNHPDAGGTHLPDLTVVTPIFSGGEIIFYVASRGHHSDIGGIGITSMVPDSKELWQEGISIKGMRIVEGGHLKEKEIRQAFEDVANHPGCSASLSNKEWLICRVINKLDWWAPHIFCMA